MVPALDAEWMFASALPVQLALLTTFSPSPAHLPTPGLCPAPGTPLADGSRVVGSWRGVAVLARSYPVAKGGPLGWEVSSWWLGSSLGRCASRRRTCYSFHACWSSSMAACERSCEPAVP